MAFKGYFVHHQYCSDVTLLFLIGGILILEAQSFSGYRKKKRLTERIFENFQNIKLRPEGFSDYLLHEVGFESGTMIAVPNHSSQGFQRPLQVNLLFGNLHGFHVFLLGCPSLRFVLNFALPFT